MVQEGIPGHWAERFLSILFLSLSSSACKVRHSNSMSLYILARSSNSLKNSLYSTGKYVNLGNSKLVYCHGFLANTNSNGDKPCSAVDTKVFIAYALTAAYKGHEAPFCVKCLFIMFPIV